MSQRLSPDQLIEEQAIAFDDGKRWVPMTHEEHARFQFGQELLCMPFCVFHEATTKALGRDMIPAEKRVVIDTE